MSDKSTLTAERLRHLLDYDSSTGVFTWRISPSPRVKPGDIAGTLNERGYLRIKIDGKHYRAHRLAFLHKDGEWPAGQVDHIDTNRSNNRRDNLRTATPSQNQWNRGAQRNNTSGFPGVHQQKRTGKYVARLKYKGRRLYLGCFPTAREASEARELTAKALRGEYYHPPSAA